jgi:hypothetical protein
MKRIVLLGMAVAIAALSGLDGCSDSRDARWDRLTKQFVACTPDTLTDDHRREIAGLLETFWSRARIDEVFDDDIALVESELQRFIDAGGIDPDTLLYFMALVGYNSYRKDPRMNLPERIVDHPTLNPDAAIVMFGADTTGTGNRIQMYYRVPGADSTADSTGADTTKAPPKKGRLKEKN